jgi:hypothetical protein
VTVDVRTGKVEEGGDDALRARIERALSRVHEAMRPCALDFES